MEKGPTNISTICFEWEATFNTFTDPVSIHDNQFRIVKINPALASLLKEKPENILGKNAIKSFMARISLWKPARTCRPFRSAGR